MKEVIQIENLSFAYNNIPVLENINLTIYDKDFIGVIGPNGGGKTILLKLTLNILKPTIGSIKIFGKPPSKVINQISYVPQFSGMDKNFPIKTKEVVEMGVCDNTSLSPWFKKDKVHIALESLNSVGLGGLANKPKGKLSGVQQPRCLIARALASHPRILLLDEPTTSVDITVEEDIYELLKKLNSEITIILASHDLGFISTYVNRIACVNRELVCHDTDEISSDKIINDAYHNNIAVIKHKCKL